MIDIASKHIIPAVVRATKSRADTVIAVREAGADASVQSELLTQTSALLAETKKALTVLEEAEKAAADVAEGAEQATYYRDVIVPAMAALRAPVDELEMIVDKEVWPMPSYGDLIFEG